VSELGSDLAAADRLPASTTRTNVAIAANWSMLILPYLAKVFPELRSYYRNPQRSMLPGSSRLTEFDMTQISRAPCQPRESAGGDNLACPLAFSVTGLLMHGLALMVQNHDGWPAPIGFTLIAAAPALAAIAALHFAGDLDEARS